MNHEQQIAKDKMLGRVHISANAFLQTTKLFKCIFVNVC